MTKDLGFGRSADHLRAAAQLKPQPITDCDPTPDEIELQIASQPNVIRQTPSRDQTPVLLRKRKALGPSNPLNFRMPIPQFNRFVALSTRWDKTYTETLLILMDAAGISADGSSDKLSR